MTQANQRDKVAKQSIFKRNSTQHSSAGYPGTIDNSYDRAFSTNSGQVSHKAN